MPFLKSGAFVLATLALTVIGLFIIPTQSQQVANTSTAAAPLEREVTFTSQGWVKLAGTLTLPTHAAGVKVPGLILIAGSGPTDRNGNQGALHTDLLQQIAAQLARNGIATLRYDKRGIGGSKTDLKDVKWEDYAAWEGFVADAITGLSYLQQQPEIDAARTGFLGHSEGGLLALQAAQTITTTHPPSPQMPRVLVLASTPGRPLDVVVREQLSNILKRQHATDEQAQFFLDKNDAIVQEIRQTGAVPKDVPPGLAALYPPYIGKFYRSLLQVDPPQLASQFPGPVLILQGEKDIQVQAAKDAPALDAGLKRRTHDDHQLFVVTGASHNLKAVKDDAEPGFEGLVAPAALDTLTSWLQTKLAAKNGAQ
ncbi:MAG: alpha/beta fold hydrolase [Abitibacteriaceae bacterium]|nr:alpha/beta fold hydrolase [Abditibacteriaceae bacterium]